MMIPAETPVKILSVEDDELLRLGLRVRLQQDPGLEIVAEASDGETTLELVKQQPFDIVLLDVGLPGIGGIETCRQLKELFPALPVLVLTSRTERSLVARLIAAGAQGYCLKGVAPSVLILAIRSIVAGASWWDKAATDEIRLAFNQNPVLPAERGCLLTTREQEILRLVATGKTNQEIAEVLVITPGTVRVHIHTILHKLGVRDRAQAVMVATQQQLLTAN